MIDDLFQLSRQLIRVHSRPYRRYFIRQTQFTAPCSILLGSRGVGKTTILIQHLTDTFPDYPSSRDCLYLPVDHAAIGTRTLFEIARDFAEQGGKLLCVDEVHKHLAWSRDLKSIRDSYPGLRLVVSGSSMLHIRQGSHDLSRRAMIYHLHGLSFREFIELRLDIEMPLVSLSTILAKHESLAADIATTLENHDGAVLGLFRDYLEYGYYPIFLELKDPVLIRMAVEQSAHAALESDLLAIHPEISGVTVARVKKLLAALATTTPMIPNLSRLAGMIDVKDSRTMKTYLGYLEEAGLIIGLTRGGGGLRDLQKPEIIYLGDPNLMVALSASGTADIGALRETFFCRMLMGEHDIRPAVKGDFVVNGNYTFEVGGRNKSMAQVRDVKNSWLALDELICGVDRRIPLWLFGFLY
jgi:predicted AAA+ superfamily ATPase